MSACKACAENRVKYSLTGSSDLGPCKRCGGKGISCTRGSRPVSKASNSQLTPQLHLPQREMRSRNTARPNDLTLPESPPKRQKGNNNSGHIKKEVQDIHIGIDLGQELTKAAFVIRWRGPNGLHTGKAEIVVWRNGDIVVNSQVAINQNGELFCAEDVDEEITQARIDGRSLHVIRELKSKLLDPAKSFDQDLDQDFIHLMKAEYVKTVSESLHYYGEELGSDQTARLALYSAYLGQIYHKTLRFIAETHGILDWPEDEDMDSYKMWSPPEDVCLHVSLALPVKPTSDQVQFILTAARAAGLPNPHPVAEPACALIYHLSELSESGADYITEKVYLILDVGAGSADLQVWKVEQANPLQVRELELPGDIKTAWCGGSYVDEAAAEIVVHGLGHEINRVLQAMERNGSTIKDEKSLRSALAAEFEKEKKGFNGKKSLYLRIPGLPNIPELRLQGGDMVVLSAADVVQAFSRCLDKIIEMTDGAIEHLQRTTKIDEIIVVGGCMRNHYVRRQFRGQYSVTARPHQDRIPITIPSTAAEASVTVAKGAVLLSKEKHLIKTRRIRRSFCVGWFVEPDKNADPEGIERSEVDGRKQIFATKFLLRKGVYPQVFKSKPLQGGWRGLLSSEFKGGESCLVTESQYYSETLSKDGLWIGDPGSIRPGIDLHEMPNALSFSISRKDLEHFPRERNGRDDYYRIPYDVELTLDGFMMTLKFAIPRIGKWPMRGDRWADVMYKEGAYDTTGMAQLFSSA